ncbi:MAG: hypothetical protein PUG74_11615 [Prevotellaceae bacterium]|nr:hypothetical protein [Prevotellaceae bacterium]
MKKYIFLMLLSLTIFACGGRIKPSQAAINYAESISGTDVLKAEIADTGTLIIAIDAVLGMDYDKLAEFYLGSVN